MTAIYLIRHAIAFDRDPRRWPDDRQRPLTHKGGARMREVMAGLRAFGVELDLVITSPLVRAAQTADIVIAGLEKTPALEVSDALAPGQRPAAVVKVIGDHAKTPRIGLIGHEPGLGELAAWLVGAKQPFAFKKGGVACIHVATLPIAGPGQLQWLATPKMLRALAAGG
jgi:phosphohistidine phosphatase